MSFSLELIFCLHFKLFNRLMLTYNCLTCPELSHRLWCISSSVRTQSPGFVHDVNIQNKVYGNTQHFYWIPISLSDSTYETLTLRLFSTENTKYFILAEVSFYSTMIILLFRAHPKTSTFLCIMFCLPLSVSS